jgi:hypothetical protein
MQRDGETSGDPTCVVLGVHDLKKHAAAVDPIGSQISKIPDVITGGLFKRHSTGNRGLVTQEVPVRFPSITAGNECLIIAVKRLTSVIPVVYYHSILY